MVLLLLEALGALVILLLIVWWTMFSGRPNGELPTDDGADKSAEAEAGQAADAATGQAKVGNKSASEK